MKFEHLGIIVRGDKRFEMTTSLIADIYARTWTVCDPRLEAERECWKGEPITYFYIYAHRLEIEQLVEDFGYKPFVEIVKAGVPEWNCLDRSVPTDIPVKVIDKEPDALGHDA